MSMGMYIGIRPCCRYALRVYYNKVYCICTYRRGLLRCSFLAKWAMRRPLRAERVTGFTLFCFALYSSNNNLSFNNLWGIMKNNGVPQHRVC